ncbi:MAG: hypothetical protein M3Y06_10200, partial [Actinomycetota bacterium]|nr:hypothetical protein [Actinomycetota bacterium]
TQYPPATARVAADLDELHELIRVRDGARIAQTQVRAAARSASLPVEALLSAGALLDRAARYEHKLDDQLADRVARFIGRRSAARVAELSSGAGR